ncbi:cell wall metabolism sensor histidine kinase WalK [Georgenia sp. SYP-B2076]|uniref:sensor histidine kinase n=1 Tax=Georgenia sp. SYP-B2076 TaxID=2495881 RepID=UPI000F8D01D8|nr:ATP-binding protein [Georgenia sp. SYP-B2076]
MRRTAERVRGLVRDRPAPGESGTRRPTARLAQTSHLSVFIRQLPFAAVTFLLALGVLVLDPRMFEDSRFSGGLMVAFVATALSVSVPWRRLPRGWSIVVPLMDMAAIAPTVESEFRLTTLLVLPTLWMSTVFGKLGVVTSVVAGTAAAWGPRIAHPHIGAGDVQRMILLPIVFAAVGLYVHFAEQRAAARHNLLGRQSALVEETLERSRQQGRLLDSILNTIDVGVIAIDRAGHITLINRAQAEVLGGRFRVGDHVSVRGGVDGYAADRTTPLGTGRSPLVRASRGENIDRELTWWDYGTGELTAFRVSSSQLTDERGDRDGAVVVYQDLTAEMAALAQRDDFVASVSHELRTPLTSILGYLELAIDDESTPGVVRNHLSVAERNGQRLLRLISDLLTAGKTRSGGLDLFAAPIDLRDVVAEAVQGQGPRAERSTVQVTNHVTTPCPLVGDHGRLLQVVDNVLSNAIKYSRPGDRVVIENHREPGEVCLSIRDTGIGISARDQTNIFSRFYRAEAVRKGPIQGTGLGLHISRSIVEAHGGTITLTSAPGVGTRVDIRLPLPDPTEEERADGS